MDKDFKVLLDWFSSNKIYYVSGVPSFYFLVGLYIGFTFDGYVLEYIALAIIVLYPFILGYVNKRKLLKWRLHKELKDGKE